MKRKAHNPEVAFPDLHRDLIKGCIRGDQKAQLVIYKLYYKTMYNTSLRIVKNASEAEDIMQESFLCAFENMDAFSGIAGFIDRVEKMVQKRSLDLSWEKSKKEQEHFTVK